MNNDPVCSLKRSSSAPGHKHNCFVYYKDIMYNDIAPTIKNMYHYNKGVSFRNILLVETLKLYGITVHILKMVILSTSTKIFYGNRLHFSKQFQLNWLYV